MGSPGRLPEGERRPALQPGRQPERVLRHRHGLLGRLGVHRPGGGARDCERADLALRVPRRNRRRQGQPSKRRRGAPTVDGPVVDSRDRVSAAQQPQPVLELHLLPRRPRERRSVRAGRTPDDGWRACHLPTAGSPLRAAHGKRGRCAGPAGLARSCRPVSHGGAAAALDDERGSRRADHERRLRAERDRMGACVPDDGRTAGGRLSVLGRRPATR